MYLNEKPINGTHLAQPNPSSLLTLPKPSLDNASSTSSLAPTCEQATPTEEYDPTSQHPFSAFYSHPTTRTSLEQHKSESKDHIKVYEQDLEAGSQTFSSSDVPRPSKGYGNPGKSKGTKNLCMQKAKGWSPVRNLSKTQALLVKILIALIIVGAAVGIGIGISKAVGAGVWKNNNSRTDIGAR